MVRAPDCQAEGCEFEPRLRQQLENPFCPPSSKWEPGRPDKDPVRMLSTVAPQWDAWLVEREPLRLRIEQEIEASDQGLKM